MRQNFQVGDLCYSYFSEEPCRIVSIREDKGGYRSVIVDKVDGIKDIASLSPIPLTPEILEKNGFVIKKKWCQLGNFDNPPIILWNLADDAILGHPKNQLEIHWAKRKYHVNDICNYVHQIQHYLRDLEIKKEIIL